jgi:hypothetical protein
VRPPILVRFGRLALAVLLALPSLSVASVEDLLAQTAPDKNYSCPMHADVTGRAPGKCSKCGMDLVAGAVWDEREYHLELRTEPAAPRAGEPVRLLFRVGEPDSGRTVTEFQVVHDKRYHLFVASQDLEHLAHVHPEQQEDGSWSIDLTLPQPGYYRIYSDFLPGGGTPQIIARTLVTAGFERDLASSIPRLSPDRTLVKTVDGTTVGLTPEPGVLVAGRTSRLRYDLARDGAPVTDLEPYLGAWGHTLVLSEDALEYVHAHPIEYLPAGAVEPRGGPNVTFDALFPKPGRYRIWTQFKRRGEVSTVSFTVDAVAANGAR